MKITIPTSLNEITVRQFMQYMAVQKLEVDDNIKAISTIAIFCNIELEQAVNISTNDIFEISHKIKEVLEQPTPLITVHDNLGFIPSLDEMSIGEYIDLESYAGNPENYNRLMAVMYRPIKQKKFGMYTVDEYNGSEARATESMDLPASLLLGGLVFFWDLGIELLKAMPCSLGPETMTLLEGHLLKDGDGISHYTQWQEGITLALSGLQKLKYMSS